MSNVTTIEAELRPQVGTSAARASRRSGRVPCILYGGQKESVAISLDPKIVHKETSQSGFFAKLFDIKYDGKTERVLARELQREPVKDTPIHIDFMRISKDSSVIVAVPLHFINEEESPGLKRGGVLNQVLHELELTCLADKIPKYIEIDMTGLEIQDTIHLVGINIPEGAEAAYPERDKTLATIVAPSSVKSEAEAAAEEAAAEVAEGEEGAEETATEAETKEKSES